MPGLMNTTENTPMRSSGFAAGAPAEGQTPADRAAPQDDTGDGDTGGQPNVTPEEQQAYDQFVSKGFELIYNRAALPRILDMLRAGDDPKEGLANTAAQVVMRLQDSAGQQGREIPPDVLYHGGIALLEDLADLAKEAGIHDFSDQEVEGALYRALDIYRQSRQSQGQLDPGPMQQDMEQLAQADRDGQLERMMPGLANHFADDEKNGPPPVAADQQQGA